jgi:hypothetical protein
LKQIGGIEVQAMEFDDNLPSAPLDNAGNATIIGILVEQNKDTVREVQKVLTSYGCCIRTRLGVNEVFYGTPAGLIILELKGATKQCCLLANDLSLLKNVHVRAVMF